MNALIVRIVAALAMVIWCVFAWPILLMATPKHLSIWDEFTDGVAYLAKRIKLGGL